MVGRASSIVDERIVAEIKRLSHAGFDGTELLRRAIPALARRVPFDVYCATTTDPATNLITDALSERTDGHPGSRSPAFGAYFEQVYFEHDLGLTLGMLQQRRAVATLAETTRGRLERSGRYRLHLRPRRLRHEAYATLVDRGLWGELHLTREDGRADFTARELDLLRRLAPHLGAGLKAGALRARAEAPGDDGPAVLIFDQRGRVISATPAATPLLAELGPLDPGWRSGLALPVPVKVVLGALERALAPASDRESRLVPRLRARTRDGRWLTLHASLTEPADDRPSERVVVVGRSQPEEIAWLTLTAYDLSPREEEVVRLVVRGSSTRQIADALFIAEHTVQRHLSNIFAKVGVRSRRALVKQLFVEQVLPSLY
jgi:DNA-binding CsgD family transcriptional regulator